MRDRHPTLLVTTSSWARRQPALSALYEAMEAGGCRIEHSTLSRFARGKAPQALEVFHLNWLDHLSRRGALVSRAIVSGKLLATLSLARLRRRRIWWTLHNLEPHENPESKLYRWILPCVFLLVWRVHLLSKVAEARLYERYPVLRRFSNKVMVSASPAATLSITSSSGLGGERSGMVRFVFFGVLRPAKQVVELVRSFVAATIPDDCMRILIVAGKPIDADYADQIRRAAKQSSAVDLRLERQSDDDLSSLISRADWCLFPYKSTTNSGALVTALQAGVPVLVTPLPYFQEILGTSPACGEYLPVHLCAIASSDWTRWADAAREPDFERCRAEARRLSAPFSPESVARELIRWLTRSAKVSADNHEINRP